MDSARDPDHHDLGYGYIYNGGLPPPDTQLSELLFPSSGHLGGSQTTGAHNVDAVLSASHYPVPQAVRIRNLFSDSHGSRLSVNEFLSVLNQSRSEDAEVLEVDADADADANAYADAGPYNGTYNGAHDSAQMGAQNDAGAHMQVDVPATTLDYPQPTTSQDEKSIQRNPKPRKKPGRPRLPVKNIEGDSNTSERRRKQLREAQRGYRMRKESRISELVRRVAQLESSMDKIVAGVVSLTEQITVSGALADRNDLSNQLTDVLQTCLQSIKETSSSNEDEDGGPDTWEPVAPLPLPSPVKTRLILPFQKPAFSPRHAILTPPNARGHSVLLPDFLNSIIYSILYYGYTLLADPATPWDRLTRHFQLVLTTIGREPMTAYFATAYDAKVRRQKHLITWGDVPLFRLGGASTHYSASPSQHVATAAYRYPEPRPTFETIDATTAAFPTELHDEMEGDWFDFVDLQLFLKEKALDLRTGASPNTASLSGCTDATAFARALVAKTTCLGRSAGFRRSDVEAALKATTFT